MNMISSCKKKIVTGLLMMIPLMAMIGFSARTRAEDTESARAFLEAYKVFMHPRCMNCHPRGDAPLVGDDSGIHSQNVKRGPEGEGKYALKCMACHQNANLTGENMPPGAPNWRLPPPETPMIFEGRTPAELAAQFKDEKQTGGKTLEKLLDHVSNDGLVLWGWDPGSGRTKPPLSHEDFVRFMKKWIDSGAEIPQQDH
jgi:hypothetical protein